MVVVVAGAAKTRRGGGCEGSWGNAGSVPEHSPGGP